MTVALAAVFQVRELVYQVFYHNSAICRVGIDRDFYSKVIIYKDIFIKVIIYEDSTKWICRYQVT